MYPDAFRATVACVLIIGALALLAHIHGEHDAAPPVPEPTTRALPSPAPVDEPRAVAYVGNHKSHKFHKLTCTYANCPNCTTKFATRDEAIAAGYRPCGTCKP